MVERSPYIAITRPLPGDPLATLAAADLDVFEREPEIHPDLIGQDRAFLLPHWGSTTDEDRLWMTAEAVGNVIAALAGAPLPDESVYDVCQVHCGRVAAKRSPP